jgi:phospholipid-binding lipoprotein MlaA
MAGAMGRKTKKHTVPATIMGAALAAFVTTAAAVPQAAAQTAGEPPMKSVSDPAEGLNRAVFEFNRALDTLILKPAAVFYKDVLPPPFQRGIRNFLNNLRSPIILFNDVLQGEPQRAGETVGRFLINSTVGIAGLRDQAGQWGIYRHDEDFGQTLAVWGMGDGPYLMLPVFGPSNPRDTVGLIADTLMDPVGIWARGKNINWVNYARSGGTATERRAAAYDTIEDLERTSLDFYATVRSLYKQRRDDEITNGEGTANMPAPGLSFSPNDDGAQQGEVPESR